MAESARDTLHREREALWDLKQLMLRFRGDNVWLPTEMVETDHDALLLEQNPYYEYERFSHTDTNTTNAPPKINGIEHDLVGISAHADAMDGVHTIDMAAAGSEVAAPETLQSKSDTEGRERLEAIKSNTDSYNINGEIDQEHNNSSMTATGPDLTNKEHGVSDIPVLNGTSEEDQAMAVDGVRKSMEAESSGTSANLSQPQHRMTTRAKARTPPLLQSNHQQHSAASRSISPAASTTITDVNNFFIPPLTAIPDRDFGLPAQEADDTRRLLLLYVQKQEQIVRSAESLLLGLLKADRLRKNVLAWCKADEHLMEMSDGEDWYDLEEWGLEKDLVKGKEEEDVEEEAGRKGRRRREGKKVTATAGMASTTAVAA